MKNITRIAGIAAMIAVIGFSFAACSNGTTDPGVDSALNGTWALGSVEYTFSNGTFEITNSGVPAAKGSYTTSGGRLTMSYTTWYGDYLSGETGETFESKWYSRAETKTVLIDAGISDAEVEEFLEDTFASSTGPYSVSGDTLTITYDSEVKLTRV